MRFPLYGYGSDAKTCFSRLSVSPRDLMVYWEEYLIPLVRAPQMPRRGYKAFTEGWEEGDTLWTRFGEHGVQRMGPWRERGKQVDPQAKLIIHLPTVLKHLADMSLTCPPLLFLMGILSGKRKQRYMGWPENLFVRINSLFPGVVHNALVKKLPIIRHHAGQ